MVTRFCPDCYKKMVKGGKHWSHYHCTAHPDECLLWGCQFSRHGVPYNVTYQAVAR
jgi:hypothetical protein